MTTDLILEQLIIDRRANLVRRWPKRRTRTDPGRSPVAPATAAPAPQATLGATTDWAPTADWATLAHRVAEHGLSGNEAAIAQLVRTARRLQLPRVVVDALSDRTLPDVVRERALGRLLASVVHASETDQAALTEVA
jgi:hypothetical protein